MAFLLRSRRRHRRHCCFFLLLFSRIFILVFIQQSELETQPKNIKKLHFILIRKSTTTN